jgi:transcriptional regulator GlxA family with amidase domain
VQIALALYDRFTALDIMGPYQVLNQFPGAEVVFVADHRGPIHDDSALTAIAEAAFDEVTAPDVIVLPGGLITRRMARDGAPVIDWAKAVHPTTTWTTSVCTGSILLGAAGILDGLDATSHWMALQQLEAFGARPTSQRVVFQGKVVTAAGVSSGIDMALTLVDRMAGPFVAQAIQLGIEYDPQPPHDTGSPEKAPKEVLDMLRDRLEGAERRILAD